MAKRKSESLGRLVLAGIAANWFGGKDEGSPRLSPASDWLVESRTTDAAAPVEAPITRVPAQEKEWSSANGAEKGTTGDDPQPPNLAASSDRSLGSASASCSEELSAGGNERGDPRRTKVSANVRLRADPSAGAAILATIRAGTEIAIIKE